MAGDVSVRAVAPGPVYSGGNLAARAAVDYCYHILVNVGTRQSFREKQLFTLQIASGVGGHGDVAVEANDLQKMDKAVQVMFAGAERIPGWEDAAGTHPGSESSAAHRLMEWAAQALPLEECRVIVESYLRYRAHAPAASRSYSRISVVAGAPRPLLQGKATVMSLTGLTTITTSQVEQALEDAMASRRDLASRPETGRYEGQVLFSPAASGIVLHEVVGHLAEADNYIKATKPTDVIKEKLSSDLLTVRDLGAEPGAWGSVQIDDELVPTREVRLVENGVLTNLLTSQKYAVLSGGVSTGHGRTHWPSGKVVPRMARLEMAAGPYGPEELRGGVGEHLYVETIHSAFMNPRTREVSLELGRVELTRSDGSVEPRVGGVIKMNLNDLMSKLAGVASDVQWSSSICFKQREPLPVESCAPTTLFSSMTVEAAS